MVESKRTFELLYDEPFNVKLLEDSLNEIKENSFDVLYRAQYKMNDMQRFDLKMGEFTLDFDANGGTCDVENKIVRYGKGVGNLPIATREGYVFIGWYTQPEGGYLFDASKVIDTLTDIPLYAHWELPENVPKNFDIRAIIGDYTKVKYTNQYIIEKKRVINRYDREFRRERRTTKLTSEELIVYNIPIDFIHHSRRAKFKNSKYYKQYVNQDTICANPDIFTNIFLVFIDGELYTNYKVKPFENITMLGFKINGNMEDTIIKDGDKVVPRNFFTFSELQKFAINNSHMTIISISNCNTIKSKITTVENIKSKYNSFYLYYNYEDDYYTRPLNSIERTDPAMSFIAPDPVRLYKYRYIDSELKKTEVSVNDTDAGVQYMTFDINQLSVLSTSYTQTITHFMLNNWKTVELEPGNKWFMLELRDMPVPVENMMVFKFVNNEYLYDHTTAIDMYYPNIYRVTTDHKEKIKIFVFYDDDTTAVLGKHDNELKLYHRFAKNILDKYKNDTIPEFIKNYKAINKPYSIKDYDSITSTTVDGVLVNNGITPLIYKINKFKELIKLRGEYYKIYLNKLVGYEPTYYIDVSDGSLPKRMANSNSEVIKYLIEHPNDENKYDDERFTEPHYLFKFSSEGFNNQIIMFLDTKLYYPTKAYHTEQFLFIYIPIRLINENTIIEISKGVNKRFKKEIEYKPDHSYTVVDLPRYMRISVDDLYISYESTDGNVKYMSEDDYDIYCYNVDSYANTDKTEYFRYPKAHIILYRDPSPSHKYILRADKINFTKRHVNNSTFNIDNRINDDMRNIRIFKNGKLIPKKAHKMNWNKENVFGIHKAKALMNNGPSDEFVFVYSDVKHSLIYYQPQISPKGYIDVEGKIEKPLDQKWYDFYLNGHKLTKDNIDIITPTKMIVKGINSTRNFCIYERELYQQDGIYETNYIDDQIIKLDDFLDEILDNYDDIDDIEEDIMDDVIEDLIEFILEYWMYFEFINPDVEQIDDDMVEPYYELFDENNNLFLNVGGRSSGTEYNILLNPDIKGVPFIKKTI